MTTKDYQQKAKQINGLIQDMRSIRNETPTWVKTRYWQNRDIYHNRFDWAKGQFHKYRSKLSSESSVMSHNLKKVVQAKRICDHYAEEFCKSFKTQPNYSK